MLTKRDIEDVERLLSMLVNGSPSEAVVASGLAQPIMKVEILRAAREELWARRRRSELLPDNMFGEPAWEIVLLLYINHHGARFTIARLSRELPTPLTSILRWLNYLQDKQLIVRQAHPTDQRSIFVSLTESAVETMDQYFAEKLTRGS